MITHRRLRNHRPIGKVTRVAAILAAVIGSAAWGNAPASAMTISPVGLPGQGLNYTKCADEGGTCVAQGIKYLAFGANGSYMFRTSFSFGNISCDKTTFGGTDPAPNVVKACYFSNYEFKASENQGSNTLAPRNIAFGANGSFYFATINGGFTCNTATFGDPAPGIVKSCYQGLGDNYIFGTTEGGTLTGLSNTPIAYGANGTFYFTVASNSFSCSNASFGGDPAANVVKNCYTWGSPFITNEGNSFNAGTVNTIFYFGSGLNGNFVSQALKGTASCTSATFGGDPDFGHFKQCYGRPQ